VAAQTNSCGVERKKREREAKRVGTDGIAEFGSELLDDEGEAAGDLLEHGVAEGPVLLGRDLALDLPSRHPQLHQRQRLLRPRQRPHRRASDPTDQTSLLADVDRAAGQPGPKGQRDPDATDAMRLVRARQRGSISSGRPWRRRGEMRRVSPSAALSVVRWQALVPFVITLVVRVG